MYILGELQ